MPASDETSSTLLGEIEQGPSKFEQFLDKNQKTLIVVAAVLVLLVAGYIVLSGINKSKGEAASAALANANSVEEYQDVIDSHKGSAAAGSSHLMLANEQWKTGNKEESVETLNAFLDSYPDHPAYPVALVNIAGKLSNLGKYDESKKHLQEAKDFEESGFAGIAEYLLAEESLRQGDSESALVAFEKLAESGESDESAFLPQLAEQATNYAKSPLPKVVEASVPEEEAPEK